MKQAKGPAQNCSAKICAGSRANFEAYPSETTFVWTTSKKAKREKCTGDEVMMEVNMEADGGRGALPTDT